MTYDQILKELFAARSTKEKGLENIKLACQRLNSPEKTFAAIHIAGTNGKGSVSHKIAKTLELSGYKVGLYTSPHILNFEERIQINGMPITKHEVMEGMKKIFPIREGLSFFEMTTLLCFLYFSEKKVDIAVLETGLGGRFDATNVASTILSVITSIGLDHTAELGNTLEEIAKEKAGIIKQGIQVVLGPKVKSANILTKAEELHAPIIQCIETHPFYDEENSLIAKEALKSLTGRFSISQKALFGLKARPPCRFEEKEGVIFDVAHNPDGFQALIQALHLHYSNIPYQMIIGLSKDKNMKSCLELCKNASHIYLVQANTPRAAHVNELEEILQRLEYKSYSKEGNVKEALAKAKASEELPVICGSFFLMEEALRS